MGCFIMVYEMLLKKEKCFSYNRFFLLLAPIVSLMIPFLNFPFFHNKTPIDFVYNLPTLVSEITTIVEPQATVASPIRLTIITIYLIGVIVSLVVFLIKIWQIKSLIKDHKFTKKHLGDYTIVLTEGQLPTFTFMNYLFLDNAKDLEEKDIDQIIKHEETHIKQRHSYDIIIMEILGVLIWFNPFIYILKKSIKENHEYLADSSAKELVGTKQYAILLIKQVARRNKVPLVNFFSMALTKKRIQMLTTAAKNPEKGVTKPLLIIPMFAAVIIFLFSFKSVSNKTITRQYIPGLARPLPESYKQEAYRLAKEYPNRNFYFSITKDIELEKLKAADNDIYRIDYTRPLKLGDAIDLKKQSKAKGLSIFSGSSGMIYSFPKGTIFKYEFEDKDIYDVEQVSELPRPWKGYDNLFNNIQNSLNLPEQAKLQAIKGEVIIKYVVNPMGQVIFANIEKGIGDIGDQQLQDQINGKALRAVVKSSGQWRSGRLDDNWVNVRMSIPVRIN